MRSRGWTINVSQVSFSAPFFRTIAIFMHMLLFLFSCLFHLNMLIPFMISTSQQREKLFFYACESFAVRCLWAAFASDFRTLRMIVNKGFHAVSEYNHFQSKPFLKSPFDVTVTIGLCIHLKQSDYNHRFSTQIFGDQQSFKSHKLIQLYDENVGMLTELLDSFSYCLHSSIIYANKFVSSVECLLFFHRINTFEKQVENEMASNFIYVFFVLLRIGKSSGKTNTNISKHFDIKPWMKDETHETLTS